MSYEQWKIDELTSIKSQFEGELNDIRLKKDRLENELRRLRYRRSTLMDAALSLEGNLRERFHETYVQPIREEIERLTEEANKLNDQTDDVVVMLRAVVNHIEDLLKKSE